MALKRKRIIEQHMAQELILYSDSNKHISEDKISHHESDSEKDGTETKRNYTRWSDNT
jgi:hypothetical protein